MPLCTHWQPPFLNINALLSKCECHHSLRSSKSLTYRRVAHDTLSCIAHRSSQALNTAVSHRHENKLTVKRTLLTVRVVALLINDFDVVRMASVQAARSVPNGFHPHLHRPRRHTLPLCSQSPFTSHSPPSRDFPTVVNGASTRVLG